MIHQTNTRFQLGSKSLAGFPILYDGRYRTQTEAEEARARINAPDALIFRVVEVIEELKA